MAKVSYQLMPPEYEDYFRKNLSPNWRFELPRVMRTERFISRAKKKALIEQSKLPEISSFWEDLTPEQKEEWNEIASSLGLIGWRLFVQDTTERILKGLDPITTPAQKHQSFVGHLEIKAPASSLKIVQPHPAFYWLSRIISGRYPLTELVWVNESFSLPLKIALNYRSELQPLSSSASASFFVLIWSVAHGQDFFQTFSIPLSLNLDWTYSEKIIEEVIGTPLQYDIYFDLKDVRGDFFFDNIIAEHSGFNFARDPACNKIEAEFSRSFFQVLRNWIAIDVSAGAKYFSELRDFDPISFPAFYGLGAFGLSRFGLEV